jgi:NitT/TauT family transport system ATP-binding protein
MTDIVLVRASALSLTFPSGEQALRDLTFAVRPGEFVAVIGPSGCGKTTLLRLMAGLLRPTGGELAVVRQEAAQRGRASGEIAFVFQEPTLLPWRNVGDNVRLPLELCGVEAVEQERRIQEALQMVELGGDRGQYPRELSGGMRMRASLARALVTRPRLLLLDEPFAALDEFLRQQLNEKLLEVWQERGWAGVFVTHSIAEAVFLSQRVLVLSQRPATLLAEIAVPFQYPRREALRADHEFVRVNREVTAALQKSRA